MFKCLSSDQQSKSQRHSFSFSVILECVESHLQTLMDGYCGPFFENLNLNLVESY